MFLNVIFCLPSSSLLQTNPKNIFHLESSRSRHDWLKVLDSSFGCLSPIFCLEVRFRISLFTDMACFIHVNLTSNYGFPFPISDPWWMLVALFIRKSFESSLLWHSRRSISDAWCLLFYCGSNETPFVTKFNLLSLPSCFAFVIAGIGNLVGVLD